MMNKYLVPKNYFGYALQSKKFRVLLEKVMPLKSPGFLIVGAQKSGTSSLHYYLSQHPNLVSGRQKEMQFFSVDEKYKLGREWYLNKLKNANTPFKNGILFEATPEYLYYERVPQRVYDFDPKMKIIIILREPVKRAYSAWNMYRDIGVRYFDKTENELNDGEEKKRTVEKLTNMGCFMTFEESIDFEKQQLSSQEKEAIEPSFLRRGIYLPQVKRYCDLFGKDRVLILGFKDLIQDKKNTLNKVLAFLNLPENAWDFLSDDIKNSRSYSEKIRPETEQQLKKFYEPYNDSLFEYTGTKLNW